MDWTPDVVVGPWTVTVPCAQTHGRLQIEVVGEEGRQTHTVAGEWDLAVCPEGRFGPVGSWKSGRLCGLASDWDTVEACGSSSSAQH